MPPALGHESSHEILVCSGILRERKWNCDVAASEIVLRFERVGSSSSLELRHREHGRHAIHAMGSLVQIQEARKVDAEERTVRPDRI